MQFIQTYSFDRSLQKFYIALTLSLSSLVLGTLGFMIIENYDLLDAFFMTIITVSTVGYTEVEPLSKAGRIFTSGYIIVNIIIFAYVISVVTTYIFEGELKRVYRNILTGRELDKLNQHVIVCGVGRNGQKVCEELHLAGREFIVIEQQESALEKIQDDNIKAILGDATQDDILLRAGLERAQYLITTLPKDAENVFITLTAKEINPQIKIIARASDDNSESKLKRAGADRVVMPDALGGRHMASLITKPDVIEFLELMQGVGSINMKLEEFTYDDLKKDYRDKTIAELDIRKHTHATVLACKDMQKGFIFNPPANTQINQSKILIIIGKEEQVDEFKSIYSNS